MSGVSLTYAAAAAVRDGTSPQVTYRWECGGGGGLLRRFHSWIREEACFELESVARGGMTIWNRSTAFSDR